MPFLVKAQITQIEYFIDNNDPGFGNATAVPFTSSNNVDVTFNVPLNNISDGLHWLYIRAKDANNNWSLIQGKMFMKFSGTGTGTPQVNAVEYYIDTDPGVGNGTMVSIPAGNDVDFTFNVDLSNVSTGLHTLYIRARDNLGRWSFVEKKSFVRYVGTGNGTSFPKITAIEYYIDTDPGEGSATAVSFTPDSIVDVTFNADLSSVADGVHTLYIRAKDNYGRWSFVEKQTFVTFTRVGTGTPKIVEMEYFIDEDPGYNNGTAVAFTSGSVVDVNFNMDLSTTDYGLHTIYVRAKDDYGRWSLVSSMDFCQETGSPAFSYQGINNTFDVLFQAENRASSYLWDFGNGYISTQENPSMIYAAAGNYNVCCTYYMDCDTQTYCQNIPVPSIFTYVLAPALTLSSSSVPSGGTLDVSGQGFTPYRSATIRFYGAVGVFDVTVPTDNNGSFTHQQVMPNGAISHNGFSLVNAVDDYTEHEASSKTFYITPTVANTSTAYLNVISPQQGDSYEVDKAFNFTFEDKMQRSYNGYNYPMKGNTAERKYQYKIEYQEGSSGTWQPYLIIFGDAFLNSTITETVVFTLPNPNSHYKIRVTDLYEGSIISESDVFSLVPAVGGVVAELVWDYSFPKPNVALKGVAADGVSRIYIRLKKAAGTTVNLQNAVVVLSDTDNSMSTALLGKVKPATETRKYSTEANDADQPSTTAYVDANGDIWIWYVAPDDFAHTDAAPYGYRSQRTVTATIAVNMANGTVVNKSIDIIVVRPPLMMVHGLNGSEHSFDDFKHSAVTSTYNFINSPLFKQKKAVNLLPNGSFWANANLLLSPSIPHSIGGTTNPSLNYENTLQGNVDMLRQQGYACNQVDYVCHSMGGLMLRTAMSELSDRFYSTGVAANSPYKTYESGYVHKLITINSPHGGSPVADGVEEFTADFSFKTRSILTSGYLLSKSRFYSSDFPLWNFITPTDLSNPIAYKFGPTPAVLDLRVQGSPSLAAVYVKHHYITGSANLINNEFAAFLASMDQYVELLNSILEKAIEIGGPVVEAELTPMLKLGKTARAFTFLEWYSEQKGYPNFLGKSDLVVPLASQISIPAPSGITVPLATNTTLYTGVWSANHLSIVNNLAVGDRVKELLNTPMNSPLFRTEVEAIPKPPVVGGGGGGGSWGGKSSTRTKNVSPSSFNTTNTFVDTSKIVLISPLRNSVVFADSMLTIEYRVKDTVNLLYTNYLFQSSSDLLIDTIENYEVTLQATPNMLGQQTIWVTATYKDTVGVTTYYMDSLSVIVQTNQVMSSFTASPKYITMYKGDVTSPSYQSIYPTFVADIPINDNGLTVTVANPNIINFNNNRFEAIDTLSTYAVIAYNGMIDTVYFDVLDTNVVDFVCDVSISLDSLLPAVDNPNNRKAVLSLNDSTDMVIEWLDSTNLSTLTRNNLTAGTYTISATNAYTLCSDSHTFTVSSAVVPVELLSFTGKITERGNLLNWETASEINNKGFHVQRSIDDGFTWETLGFKEGKGTTLETQTYNFLDDKPINGKNYYRLKQEDFDGSVDYSETILLENEVTTTAFKVSIYPNPTTTNALVNLEIQGEALGEISYQIVDVNGRILKEGIVVHNSSSSTHQVPTPQEVGVYFIRFGNSQLDNIKFVVQ